MIKEFLLTVVNLLKNFFEGLVSMCVMVGSGTATLATFFAYTSELLSICAVMTISVLIIQFVLNRRNGS